MKRADRVAEWAPVVLLCMLLGLNACATDDQDREDAPDGCIRGDFVSYFGMFHSHSNFSDGSGTPMQAYEHARDCGGLDVFALTDHLELLYIPLPPNKWETLHDTADALYVPGSYVPLVGFEYSSGFGFPSFRSIGHNNVFFADDIFPMIMLDYHVFYDRLLACSDCLVHFNHPGYEGQTDWDGFAYDPAVDRQMNQIELSTWDLDAWPYLFEAIDQGWHVSPNWNQDNHGGGWGTEDDHRTGLWMDALTREAVHDCLRERRTYSTLDRNASIRLATVEGCWMGSILSGVLSVTLVVEAFDPDGADGFATLELWGQGMELLHEFDCGGEPWCEMEADLDLDDAGYVLARAVQDDGDLLVSAPIWLNP